MTNSVGNFTNLDKKDQDCQYLENLESPWSKLKKWTKPSSFEEFRNHFDQLLIEKRKSNGMK